MKSAPSFATLCVAVATVSFAPGCLVASADSCDIKTSGISMAATVKDDGSNTRAVAFFEAGDMNGLGTKLDLCPADDFTINGEGPRKTEKADRIEYSVTWSSSNPPENYEFVLNRRDDGDRIETSVKLPPQFEVLSPEHGGGVSRAADLEIEWEPDNPGGTMNVRMQDQIGYDCVRLDAGNPDYLSGEGVDAPDNGLVVIEADELLLVEGATNCEMTLTMVRESTGTYPPQLERGGSVDAFVERVVSFVSVP